jgi:copper(I)-binding protein
MDILRRSACLLLSLALLPSARAADCLPAIESAWVRQPPVEMPMMAGFAVIRNGCDAPVRIVSASSPAFGAVELHETRKVDGVSRMRHLPELAVPAHGQVALQPGGLHLMLMRPAARLAQGQRVEIELGLSDGRRVRGAFEVRAPNAL